MLATFARDEDARLSLAAAMNAVKELVAAESESFSKPVREPWARRVEWLSNVATRHAARLAAADSDGFNSVGRQLALAAIRRLSRPDRPAVPSPGQKIWATMPLHYFGLRNLQAIEFFERGQTAAIVDTLAEDYAAARQTIFAPDGSLVANEGERSTMMGMALYLGIARSKTRQKERHALSSEQCLSDSRRIYEHSGRRARCIVTDAMRAAAAKCDGAGEYLEQVCVAPQAADLTERVEQVWELLRGRLPLDS